MLPMLGEEVRFGVLYVEGLKANLISISQICDSKFRVNFFQNLCEVIDKKGKIILTGYRTLNNCYSINPNNKSSLTCSRAQFDTTDLWHRRLGHINYRNLIHIANKERVKGIPKLKSEPKTICGECMKGKQVKSTHKKIFDINTTRPLDLLHMDLMGPMRTESIGGKRYVLVVVDDYSRFSFVCMLREKSETLEHLKVLFARIQNEKGVSIVKIRSDRGREFDNIEVDLFCEAHGIKHEFSAPKTHQQNGVAERKNRVL